MGTYTIPFAASALNLSASYGYSKTDVQKLDASPSALTDLGITTNVLGKLDQNEVKLGSALTSNLKSVSDLFSGKDGLASRIDDAVKQYTQAGGYLDTITQGLNKGLADVNDKKAALQLRLDTYSATLTKQFNAMDAAVAALKSTQNFITQAFASINGTKTSSTG